MYSNPADAGTPASAYGTPMAERCSSGSLAGPKEAHPVISRALSAKWFIAGAWVLATLVAFPTTDAVFEDLNMMVESPRDTGTGMATERLEAAIPGITRTAPLVMVISCQTKCNNVLGPFSMEVVSEMSRFYKRLNHTNPGWIKEWDPPFYEGNLDPRIADDRQSMMYMSMWVFPKHRQEEMMQLVKLVVARVDSLNDEASRAGYTIGLQGMPAMMEEFETKLSMEINMKMASVIPIALGIFIYMVQSWRLCMLCGACLTMSMVLATATTVLWKSSGPRLAVNGPAAAGFTGIAVSVNYSMFLLTRFREELQSGKSVEAALSNSLLQSGAVVSLSGTILMLCYTCTALFPGDSISSTGLVGATMLLYCILSSLTFIPSAIAIAPNFFTSGLKPMPGEPRSTSRGSRTWLNLGAGLTRKPFVYIVPLIIYAFMLPVAWQLTKFQPSADSRAALADGPTKRTFEKMVSSFGVGDAMYMILDADDSVKSDLYFERTCAKIKHMIAKTQGTDYELRAENFESIVMVPGMMADQVPCPQPICLSWSQRAPHCPILPPARDMLAGRGLFSELMSPMFKEAWDMMVSEGSNTSVVMIAPNFDVTPGATKEYADLFRGIVEPADLYTAALVQYDMKEADYARFPFILAMLMFIICVFMGLSFRVVLAPIKLFMGVAIPLAFTFGAVVSVFQLGALDWLGWSHLDSSYGLNWMIPIQTVPLVIGLMVDYHVFIFSRVCELRRQGFDDRAAIVGAMATAGPIISSAGLIMAIAFSGLLLTSVPMNNEMGFALSFALLIDTFITRTLLMPSMLAVLGPLAYWPQQMPEATRSMQRLEEYLFELEKPQPLTLGGGSAANLLAHNAA